MCQMYGTILGGTAPYYLDRAPEHRTRSGSGRVAGFVTVDANDPSGAIASGGEPAPLPFAAQSLAVPA
jgi:hypothetical protein